MGMPSTLKNLIKSPATPAAILLYGIVFGFAMWSYLGLQWPRSLSIALYSLVAAWAMIVIVQRWRLIVLTINRVDILFCTFLFWVLGSIMTHWWEGMIQNLEFMPFFFILPYILGRMMVAEDFDIFKKILIVMAGVLLLLLPIEYIKNSQPGFLYENSPAPIIFGQSHGTMLAGLLFAAALLALISKLTSPPTSNTAPSSNKKQYRFFDYLLLASIVSAMVWIASRGPAVAVILGVITLFFFAPFLGWKKKIAILFYLSLFALVAFSISFQNKHHKEYFELLLLRPSIALGEIPRQPPKLEYGKPILGESICKDIPNSIADRWIHYRTAWEIFLAKPLTGVGANGYGFYSCTGPGWYPHTTILQVLAELGVLGGLLYLALLWVVVRVPITRYWSSVDVAFKANMGWLLAFMVLQITTNQFYGTYFMSAGLYFVMGLAANFHDGAKLKQAGI